MEWEQDFEIWGAFGKDCILKRMLSIERWYGNSETMERKNRNWKRRSEDKTNKQKIWNWTVSVHGMSEVSDTELGKYDTSP